MYHVSAQGVDERIINEEEEGFKTKQKHTKNDRSLSSTHTERGRQTERQREEEEQEQETPVASPVQRSHELNR